MQKNIKREVLKLTLDKVKLVGSGVKHDYNTISKPVIDDSNKVYYPNICLSAKEAPELNGSEVGDDKTLVIKGIITSHSMNKSLKNNNNCEDYTLEIHSVGVIK